jgi:hypothetical protein
MVSSETTTPQSEVLKVLPKKNRMVAGHFASLGFSPMGGAEGREMWSYDVPPTYAPRTCYIRRTADALWTTPNADSISVPSEV